jgi:hypothetical protein
MKSDSPKMIKPENELRNVLGQKMEKLTIGANKYEITPLKMREQNKLEDIAQGQFEIQLKALELDQSIRNPEEAADLAEVGKEIMRMKRDLLTESCEFYAEALNARKATGTKDIDADWVQDTLSEDELGSLAQFFRSLDPKDLNPKRK